MMRSLRYLMLSASLLMLGTLAMAQEVTLDALVDRYRIAAGEHIRLTITLSNSRNSFTHPDLGGLVIVSGPFESSSMKIINGSMSSTVSRQWVLTATSPGSYTIGPAEARTGNGVLRTEPIVIEVSKAAERPQDPYASQGQRGDPNLFATLSLSSRKAYVGEQVIATYTLYTRYQVLEQAGYELPKLDGFWAEEVDMGKAIWQQQMERINGLDYKVAVLKQQVLYPQRPGKLRIEPLKLSFVANRSWMSRGSRIDVTSNSVELTVTPLPGNAPPSFNGAVGDLQLSVRGASGTVNANEAIDLNVKLNGRSNLKLLDAPVLDLPADFEAYDPKVVDKITLNASGMSGSREFQYLIIPRHEGNYTINGVTFSFFDPRSGSYRTLTSEPIELEVKAGKEGSGAIVQRTRRRDVQLLDEDIRFIRTGDLGLRSEGGYLFGSLRWLAGMSAPALSFMALLFWKQRRGKLRSDRVGTRRKQADKVARKQLRQAAEALRKNDREGFHGALSHALNGYVSDRFEIARSTLDQGTVEKRFATLRDGAEMASEFTRLMGLCDMARFAPSDERPRQELYDDAASLITRMERSSRT